jgi:hypothetical protein
VTTRELVQRGSLELMSDELERIEALLGDGRAINSDGCWDSDLARLMVRLRFHQARIKYRMALVGSVAAQQCQNLQHERLLISPLGALHAWRKDSGQCCISMDRREGKTCDQGLPSAS